MTEKADIHFKKILEKVKGERNLDFSGYRENLLVRRVMSRVRLTKSGDLKKYLAYLNDHHDEMDNLMEALTINVTEFFRDARVFDAIEHRIVPELIGKERRSIRAWSCACSSGEEPYSVLMTMAKCLGPRLKGFDLHIYATDIDIGSLSKAKEGIYESTQFKNLSPERKLMLNKYFCDMGNGRYWIREEWAPYVEFIYHDVISDAPFEDMDLILCRNMLIYFDRDLQDRVVKKFHSSLKDGGFLVLGNVESIGAGVRNRFDEYDRDARIYRKS